MFERLLAKPVTGAEPADTVDPHSLPGHLSSVIASAKRIIETTATAQLHCMGLTQHTWGERLRRLVILSSAVHDIGKANDHFQRMIRTRQPQGLRHEWVAIWLLSRPEWKKTLTDYLGGNDDFQIILWTVAGHHPSFNRPFPPTSIMQGGDIEMTVLNSHRDFLESLNILEKETGVFLPAIGAAVLDLTTCGDVFPLIRTTMTEGATAWDRFSPELKKFTAVCKSCLMGCDAAGSATVKNNRQKSGEWVAEYLAKPLENEDVREVVSIKLNGQTPRIFQKNVAASRNRVTLVRAGCGSGKTVAAYMWAANAAPGKRIYFCYPTTGTATEGFRDYLFDEEAGQSRLHSKLFHGRAEVDLEMILGADNDEEEGESLYKLDALDIWSTPAVVCTADTVLGLIQNMRRSLYIWPALSQSAFIFDEIHEYDDNMFGALIRFLRDLTGVRVLLMSASLPRSMLETIQKSLKDIGEELSSIEGPNDIERLPRYRLLRLKDIRNPIDEVVAEYKSKGKILWICNTVGRAMNFARMLEECGIKPLIYHSRFRYEDRVRRHADVVNAFKGNGAVCAVCTQVAQVSLDISADLLITDYAPIPDLIQRLGRLNRRIDVHSTQAGRTKPFAVVEVENELPYRDSNAVNNMPAFPETRKWLDSLGTDDISQADLAMKWQEVDEGYERKPCESAWLDGGPFTHIVPLRNATAGITVVMEEDVDKINRGIPLARVALPMPPPLRHLNWQQWRKVKSCPVAPAVTINYDKMRGAEWRNSAE